MTGPTSRGRLKVFLGYAAGVGKTYQMLSEARELRANGIDVVVAYFEPHARKDTITLSEGLELLPRRIVHYRGSVFSEMDTEAVLQRRPKVALVDEFPHTNVPGSPRLKRWEDVQVILDAGIDVYTTMNVQHLESLNDQIWQSAGVRVRETIPDWVLKQADDIVMVDVTPRALLNRLEGGVVYAPERVRAALDNFFTEATLVALRELALRQTAHVLEGRAADADPSSTGAASTERILIVIEAHPATAALIRRGRRVADYLRAECVAVYVSRRPDFDDLAPAAHQAVQRHLTFARGLQIESRVLQGEETARTVVDFARRNRTTQIFVLRHRQPRLSLFFHRGLAQQIVAMVPDMQVTIVADRSTGAGALRRQDDQS